MTFKKITKKPSYFDSQAHRKISSKSIIVRLHMTLEKFHKKSTFICFQMTLKNIMKIHHFLLNISLGKFRKIALLLGSKNLKNHSHLAPHVLRKILKKSINVRLHDFGKKIIKIHHQRTPNDLEKKLKIHLFRLHMTTWKVHISGCVNIHANIFKVFTLLKIENINLKSTFVVDLNPYFYRLKKSTLRTPKNTLQKLFIGLNLSFRNPSFIGAKISFKNPCPWKIHVYSSQNILSKSIYCTPKISFKNSYVKKII